MSDPGEASVFIRNLAGELTARTPKQGAATGKQPRRSMGRSERFVRFSSQSLFLLAMCSRRFPVLVIGEICLSHTRAFQHNIDAALLP